MNNNLVPQFITDKNGRNTVVYKTPDGRGTPNTKERKEYQDRAKRVPAFSSHQIMNVEYADDIFLAHPSHDGNLTSLRLHEDGSAEIIAISIVDNISIEADEIKAVLELGGSPDAEPVSIELRSGHTVRKTLSDELIFDEGTTKEGYFNGYASSVALRHLRGHVAH